MGTDLSSLSCAIAYNLQRLPLKTGESDDCIEGFVSFPHALEV